MVIRKLVFALATMLSFSEISADGAGDETSLNTHQLEQLRLNPDTSKTVYMTDKVGEAKVSPLEIAGATKHTQATIGKEAREDPKNPGVFVSEGAPAETNSKPNTELHKKTGGVLKDLGATHNPTPSATGASIEKYSGATLDTHALALAANCTVLSSEGSKSTAVINLEDSFFVVPANRTDLPPKPGTAGDVGLHGIDVNQNCVRDDIEHYIFDKYPDEDQKALRLNLYSHAIWLNFFLIDPISDKTIQGIARQNIKTGKCVETLLGDAQARFARGDLFAHVHNTEMRTDRYFENMNVLRGFMIEENITGACL